MDYGFETGDTCLAAQIGKMVKTLSFVWKFNKRKKHTPRNCEVRFKSYELSSVVMHLVSLLLL